MCKSNWLLLIGLLPLFRVVESFTNSIEERLPVHFHRSYFSSRPGAGCEKLYYIHKISDGGILRNVFTMVENESPYISIGYACVKDMGEHIDTMGVPPLRDSFLNSDGEVSLYTVIDGVNYRRKLGLIFISGGKLDMLSISPSYTPLNFHGPCAKGLKGQFQRNKVNNKCKPLYVGEKFGSSHLSLDKDDFDTTSITYGYMCPSSYRLPDKIPWRLSHNVNGPYLTSDRLIEIVMHQAYMLFTSQKLILEFVLFQQFMRDCLKWNDKKYKGRKYKKARGYLRQMLPYLDWRANESDRIIYKMRHCDVERAKMINSIIEARALEKTRPVTVNPITRVSHAKAVDCKGLNFVDKNLDQIFVVKCAKTKVSVHEGKGSWTCNVAKAYNNMKKHRACKIDNDSDAMSDCDSDVSAAWLDRYRKIRPKWCNNEGHKKLKDFKKMRYLLCDRGSKRFSKIARSKSGGYRRDNDTLIVKRRVFWSTMDVMILRLREGVVRGKNERKNKWGYKLDINVSVKETARLRHMLVLDSDFLTKEQRSKITSRYNTNIEFLPVGMSMIDVYKEGIFLSMSRCDCAKDFCKGHS